MCIGENKSCRQHSGQEPGTKYGIQILLFCHTYFYNRVLYYLSYIIIGPPHPAFRQYGNKRGLFNWFLCLFSVCLFSVCTVFFYQPFNLTIKDRFHSLRCLQMGLDNMIKYIILKFSKFNI